MNYKNARAGDFEDIVKAIVLIIFGVLFIQTISPIASKEVMDSLISLGVILLVLAVIIGVIYIISGLKSDRL